MTEAPHQSGRSIQSALVLGGAGFLGSWVTQRLGHEGIETTVLGYGAHRVGDIEAAITQPALEELFERTAYGAVFFLAGSANVPRSVRDPLHDLDENARLVIEVLEALRKATSPPVFVFASSAAVYGDVQTEPMDEQHPLVPRSPYGVSKLAAEHYVRLYADTHQLPALSVRPFSVYGPGQRKLVIYDLLTRLLSGENPLVVQSPAEVARDFVFVRDVADAMIALGRRAPAGGEAYNLTTGIATTLGELTESLVRAADFDVAIRFTGKLRVGDPFRWRGDPTRAQDLGVVCSTPLIEGLRETVAWIRGELAAAPS